MAVEINEIIEPYSLLSHLCRGIMLGHDLREIGVFILSDCSVYLDDAGHPVDKNILTVAGFLATQDRWEDFKKEWNKALLLHEIEPPFHAVDFFYERRKEKKFPHILSDLVRVIANHVVAGFSSSVDMIAYRELNERYRLEECIGTPYAMVMKNLYHNMTEWKAENNFTHPTLVFVEDGTLHRGDMQECFRYRDGLVPPVFVPKDLEPCQAADLYAYSFYQLWDIRKMNEVVKAFDIKMPSPKERRDSMIERHHLEQYMKEPRVKGIKNGTDEMYIPVPSRNLTEGVDFNFKGNTKLLRKRKVK